jgi:hypothetical protein
MDAPSSQNRNAWGVSWIGYSKAVVRYKLQQMTGSGIVYFTTSLSSLKAVWYLSSSEYVEAGRFVACVNCGAAEENCEEPWCFW